MKHLYSKILLIIITLLIISCSTSKKIVRITENENCLKLDPTNYHNSRFNPKWLAENGISKIIEREYLDGRNGSIHLVNIIYLNSKGFPKTKYNGIGYPENDSPNEKDIVSRFDYTYETQDSFMIQNTRVVRFYNQHGRMEKSDTLAMGRRILNTKEAKYYKNEEREIVRTYKYDNKNRLLNVIDNKGETMFKLNYISNDKIEVEKYSHWQKEYFKSWATFNKKGQIIKNYDESNSATHEFLYNEQGELIEEKSWFKNKEPNFHTYEYVK